jgi:hypothetical protein
MISFLTIILIITIPIAILLNTLLPYGNIYYSEEYYSYQDPANIKALNIDVNIGNVEINYIPHPIDFSVQIDVEFELDGQYFENEGFSNFFEIDWQNTGKILNFSIQIKEGKHLEKILSQIRIMNIKISLKADLNCDIKVLVLNGNVALESIYGTNIGNVSTNIYYGNIQYGFSHCYLNGNILAQTQEGNIELDLFECEYFRNSLWRISTEIGNVVVNIVHKNNLGSNVTGIISTIVGNYRISYEDYTTEVGALFVFEVNQNDMSIHQQLIEIIGFDYYLTPMNGTDVYYIYSDDFPAISNYNLTFSIPVGVYEDILLSNLLN